MTGKDYTTIKMAVQLDTTEAKGSLTEIVEETKKERKMPLDINDIQAKAAIAGIDAAASRPVTKIVYVQEVSSGGGYSDYYDPYTGSYGGYTGDFTAETGGYSGGTYWLPTYGVGDVFVPEPTLAIVGDRPGGEWIGGIDQAVARFGGKAAAGQNVVVNYSPVINGASLSADELSQLLEEHDEKLMGKIAEKLKDSQYR